MRRPATSYRKDLAHRQCREALGKLVADGVVARQIEQSSSPQELGKAVSRIRPAFIAGAKSRGVGPDIYMRCPLSLHLEHMSRAQYSSKKHAIAAWKNLATSRWCTVE